MSLPHTISTDHGNMDNRRLEEAISYFSLQARYHLQQYEVYCYYAKYYAKCRKKMEKKKIVNDADSKVKYNSRAGHTTDSSCGYYFKANTTTFSKKRNTRRNKRRRGGGRVHGHCNSSIEVSLPAVNKDKVEVAEDIESSDDSEEEVDIGYQEFVRQSEEFRRERDLARLKATSKDTGGNSNESDVPLQCVEYVDVLRKGPDGTILPPTALNRKQLYEEKYGGAGTKILSLETALQWNFNTVVDATSPKLWPALPIRFLTQ